MSKLNDLRALDAKDDLDADELLEIASATGALLDLVDAVKAWRDQRGQNLLHALGPAGEDRDNEPVEVRRARVKRTADAARAVELALERLEDLP